MVWPWEQFSWAIFWAVLIALAAWEAVKWASFALFALALKIADK